MPLEKLTALNKSSLDGDFRLVGNERARRFPSDTLLSETCHFPRCVEKCVEINSGMVNARQSCPGSGSASIHGDQ